MWWLIAVPWSWIKQGCVWIKKPITGLQWCGQRMFAASALCWNSFAPFFHTIVPFYTLDDFISTFNISTCHQISSSSVTLSLQCVFVFSGFILTHQAFRKLPHNSCESAVKRGAHNISSTVLSRRKISSSTPEEGGGKKKNNPLPRFQFQSVHTGLADGWPVESG